MKKRKQVKFVHEGSYVAEVDVEMEFHDAPWAPYLLLEDAYKLDAVREALRQGDLKAASRHSRVYTMQPVMVD